MEKVVIRGYKSIKELTLSLQPINIFIGTNGSGKSNLLSFFDFLKRIYNQNLQEHVALKGIDTFLHKGSKITQEISSHLHFRGACRYSFNIKKGDAGVLFTKEEIGHENNFIDIASFGNESALRFQTMPKAAYIKNYINQLTKYHFHDTGENSPFNRISNIENDKYCLCEKGSNLSAFLYNLKNENGVAYNLIVETIQSNAPYFRNFFLVPEKNGNIKLRWQSKYTSTIYDINDLSNGTLRFIALTVLFMQPDLPETIVIDEPELGLHPTAIAKLSELIKSVAAKNCQVIMATQSTDLISHFEPEDIITVNQINGESVFERLDSDSLKDWLEIIPLMMYGKEI